MREEVPAGEEIGANEFEGQEAHVEAFAEPRDEGFKGFGNDAGRVDVGASQLDADVLHIPTQLRQELVVAFLLLKSLETSVKARLRVVFSFLMGDAY